MTLDSYKNKTVISDKMANGHNEMLPSTCSVWQNRQTQQSGQTATK